MATGPQAAHMGEQTRHPCAGLGILTAAAELLSERSADVAANRENCPFCSTSHTRQGILKAKLWAGLLNVFPLEDPPSQEAE